MKNKKIEELKAKVEALRFQKNDIDRQLNEAQGALHAAEREANRKLRLTPAMLALLREMANGTVVKENRFQSFRYHAETPDMKTFDVRSSVFYGLRLREAIAETREDGERVSRITEHGRSLVPAR